MNPLDYWQSKRYDAHENAVSDDVEPYALPIIINLNKSRDVSPPHEDAILASARAVAVFLTDEEIISNPDNRVLLDRWVSGRIRKVVRRSRDDKQWEQMESLPGVEVSYGLALLKVLLPHALSEVPAEIKRLQVSGTELPVSTTHYVNQNRMPSSSLALNICVNPDLNMSTGKIMAQTGHIAQLALMNQDRDLLDDWVRLGCPTVLSHDWTSKHDNELSIQDAGFTEIPPGSTTVKGWF